MKSNQLLFLSLICLYLTPAFAQQVKIDADLANELSSDANQNSLRRKQFKPDQESKKIFDTEREKGLADYLEEQEKWDLIREKGLSEHRKQKKIESPKEGGPEFLADQKAKKEDADKLEKARTIRVQTRDRIFSKKNQPTDSDELEELGLAMNRPRYDLRKRGQNKWVKNSSKSTSSSGGSSGGSASPPVFDDFMPQSDFLPAPQPVDDFSDIPPPPPPMNFDPGNGGYPYGGDSGFGEGPLSVPPPPPPDFDF